MPVQCRCLRLAGAPRFRILEFLELLLPEAHTFATYLHPQVFLSLCCGFGDFPLLKRLHFGLVVLSSFQFLVLFIVRFHILQSSDPSGSLSC